MSPEAGIALSDVRITAHSTDDDIKPPTLLVRAIGGPLIITRLFAWSFEAPNVDVNIHVVVGNGLNVSSLGKFVVEKTGVDNPLPGIYTFPVAGYERETSIATLPRGGELGILTKATANRPVHVSCYGYLAAMKKPKKVERWW